MKTKLVKSKREVRIEDILDRWQLMRRERLAFIMEMLESLKEVDLDQFLGSIGTEYGIRRQTSKEYLKDLLDYGVIGISDGKIKWLGKKESEEEGGEMNGI